MQLLDSRSMSVTWSGSCEGEALDEWAAYPTFIEYFSDTHADDVTLYMTCNFETEEAQIKTIRGFSISDLDVGFF